MKDLNINWPLFHRQKAMLVAMANDNDRLTSEVEVLDGVIHLMDGIQDALEPEKLDNGNMAKLNVTLLEGAALDWAVGSIEGETDNRLTVFRLENYVGKPVERETEAGSYQYEWWSPTRIWAQGGVILEREEISVAKVGRTEEDAMAPHPDCWCAHIDGNYCLRGPTPLIAAMRTFVLSRRGPTIELPEEYLQI